MDTRILDVAIGLALVFLLTSLLVTTLQEIWTSQRGLRRSFLRKAIASFAGDDEQFMAALLAHPTLVTLAEGAPDAARAARKPNDWGPSYVSAEMMVSALTGYLVQNFFGGNRPATPGEMVRTLADPATRRQLASQHGAVLPNEAFVRALAAVAMGAENDWAAFETRVAGWYGAVCERATGWFKRHVRGTVFVLGLLVAAAANINPIVIASRLWQDEPLRKAMVALAERASASQAGADGAAAILLQAPMPLPAASGAVLQVRALPARTLAQENALLGSMARFHAQVFGLVDRPVAGLEPEVIEKSAARFIEFRERVNKLLALPPVAPVAMAGGISAEHLGVYQALQQLRVGLPAEGAYEGLAKALNEVHRALVGRFPGALFPPEPESAAAEAPRSEDCENGVIKGDGATYQLGQRIHALSELQKSGLPMGWSRAAFPSLFNDGCGSGKCDGVGGRIGNLPWLGNASLVLIGWLVAALACTLGAPFWFDLLNKLVQIRGAGPKPEASEAAQGRAAAPPPGPASAPDAGGAGAEPMSDALNDAERALTSEDVRKLQRALGLAAGQLSGYFDAATRNAIRNWQLARNQPATGELAAEQLRTLQRLDATGDDDGYLG